MINPFLVGERIYLRPLELEDSPRAAAWLNDPEVRHHVQRQAPINQLAEQAFIRRVTESESDVTLAIALTEGDRLIGVMSLFQHDRLARNAALGILLGEKDTWNKGYGTEAVELLLGHAFDTLNLHRVWLEVYEFNARAVRSYEKAGFVLEGRLRQDVFRAGQYWDTFIMGVLAPEWQAWRAALTSIPGTPAGPAGGSSGPAG